MHCNLPTLREGGNSLHLVALPRDQHTRPGRLQGHWSSLRHWRKQPRWVTQLHSVQLIVWVWGYSISTHTCIYSETSYMYIQWKLLHVYTVEPLTCIFSGSSLSGHPEMRTPQYGTCFAISNSSLFFLFHQSSSDHQP